MTDKITPCLWFNHGEAERPRILRRPPSPTAASASVDKAPDDYPAARRATC